MFLYSDTKFKKKFTSLLQKTLEIFYQDQYLLSFVDLVSNNKLAINFYANACKLDSVLNLLNSNQASNLQLAQALLLSAKESIKEYNRNIFEKKVDINYHSFHHVLDFHAKNYLDFIVVHFETYDQDERVKTFITQLVDFLPNGAKTLEKIKDLPIRHKPVSAINVDVITVDPSKFDLNDFSLDNLDYVNGNNITIPFIKRTKFKFDLLHYQMANSGRLDFLNKRIFEVSNVDGYLTPILDGYGVGYYSIRNNIKQISHVVFNGYEFDGELVINDQNLITYLSDAIIDPTAYSGVSYVNKTNLLGLYGLDFHPTRQLDFVKDLTGLIRRTIHLDYYDSIDCLGIVETALTPLKDVLDKYNLKQTDPLSYFESLNLSKYQNTVVQYYKKLVADNNQPTTYKFKNAVIKYLNDTKDNRSAFYKKSYLGNFYFDISRKALKEKSVLLYGADCIQSFEKDFITNNADFYRLYNYQYFINSQTISSSYKNFYNILFEKILAVLESWYKSKACYEDYKLSFPEIFNFEGVEDFRQNIPTYINELLDSIDPLKLSFIKQDPLAVLYHLWLFNQDKSYKNVLFFLFNLAQSSQFLISKDCIKKDSDILEMLTQNFKVVSKIAKLNLDKRKQDQQDSVLKLAKANSSAEQYQQTIQNSLKYLQTTTNLGSLLTEKSPFLAPCLKKDLKLTRHTYQNLVNVAGVYSNLPLCLLVENSSLVMDTLPYTNAVFSVNGYNPQLQSVLYDKVGALISNWLKPNEFYAVDNIENKEINNNLSILDKLYLLNRFDLKILNDFWSSYLTSTRQYFSSNRKDCEIVTFYDGNFLAEKTPISTIYRNYEEFKNLSNLHGYFLYNFDHYVGFDPAKLLSPTLGKTKVSLPLICDSEDVVNSYNFTGTSFSVQAYQKFNGHNTAYFYTDPAATRDFKINHNSIEFVYSSGGKACFIEIPFVAHLGDFYKVEFAGFNDFNKSISTLIPAHSQMFHGLYDYCCDVYLFEDVLKHDFALFKERALAVFANGLFK